MDFCSERERNAYALLMGCCLKGTFIAALMVTSDKYTLGMVGRRKCRNSDTLGGDVTASLSLFLQGLA